MIQFYSQKPDCGYAFAAIEFDTCATYMTAMFGAFQAASIFELLIFTRYSTKALYLPNGVLDHTNVDGKIKFLYQVTYFAFGVLTFLMIVLLASRTKEDNIFDSKFNKMFGITTGIIFLTVTVSLTVPSRLLLKELRKEHMKFLREESRYLGVLLVLFSISYFARAVFLLGFGNWYKLQSSVTDGNLSKAYYQRRMIYYSSSLVWDLPPVLF